MIEVSAISDVHLDFGDLVLPGGDILVIAGDACEARHLNRNLYNANYVLTEGQDQAQRDDRYSRFFYEECSKYREVLYVMGNHEHYGYQFDKTAAYIKTQLPSNVHLLDKESYTVDDVVFVGCTLWTDLNNGCPITETYLRHNMNDYRKITMHKNGNYHSLQPTATLAEHKLSVKYLDQALSENADKQVIVVTHHPPSKKSSHPYYTDDYYYNGGYSSDLDSLILAHPNVLAWHHGHTHHGYRYQIGNTWLVCNPRGYINYEACANTFQVVQYTIDNGTVVFKE